MIQRVQQDEFSEFMNIKREKNYSMTTTQTTAGAVIWVARTANINIWLELI